MRPVSSARIVQRRAAIQNACRCSVEQNRCTEPPVVRGLKARPHHRHCATSAASMSDATQPIFLSFTIEVLYQRCSKPSIYRPSRFEETPRLTLSVCETGPLFDGTMRRLYQGGSGSGRGS